MMLLQTRQTYVNCIFDLEYSVMSWGSPPWSGDKMSKQSYSYFYVIALWGKGGDNYVGHL